MFGAAELTDLAVVDRPGEVGQQGVVDVVGPLRLDLAHVVDDLGDLVPRRHDGEHQRLDRVVGDGEGVAGVEHLAAVDEEPDVGDARDVRVDHRVQFTVDLYVETGGGEGVAVTDGVHAAGEGRRDLLGDGPERPDLGGRVVLHRGAQPQLVEVVRVLVGDEDGIRAERGVLLAESAGSRTSVRPSFSRRTQACDFLVSFMTPSCRRTPAPGSPGLTPAAWSPRG